MEIYIISKVISLKMKTLIFAVICTYINMDHHKDDTLRSTVVQGRGRYSSYPGFEKVLYMIFMGILLCSVSQMGLLFLM